jgi:hypothetical protein
LDDYCHEHIQACDRVIEVHLQGMAVAEVADLAPKRRVRRRRDNDVSSATRPGVDRAAQALRLAAKNLQRSQSALGAFLRRIAARRELAKAITATAYKLACIICAVLKHGMAYVAQGLEAYETAYRERVVKQMKRKAAALGLVVVENEMVSPSRGEESGVS